MGFGCKVDLPCDLEGKSPCGGLFSHRYGASRSPYATLTIAMNDFASPEQSNVYALSWALLRCVMYNHGHFPGTLASSGTDSLTRGVYTRRTIVTDREMATLNIIDVSRRTTVERSHPTEAPSRPTLRRAIPPQVDGMAPPRSTRQTKANINLPRCAIDAIYAHLTSLIETYPINTTRSDARDDG